MTTQKIKAGIIGGAGYTGGEMLRLLIFHPLVEVSFIVSRSHAGQPVDAVHQDLAGSTDLKFAAAPDASVDVLFLCMGHGESKQYLAEQPLDRHTKVVDLSQDFRLHTQAMHAGRTFVYGLPELNKDAIRRADAVANPGCFATALQLALLPLAANNQLGEVVATGITGATGAGQQLQPTSHFSWRSGNIEAYKTLSHQHRYEVMETLRSCQPGAPELSFIPWRGDFTRGIYISACMSYQGTPAEAMQLYHSFYAGSACTFVRERMIHMKQVVNTNKCLIYPEVAEGKLVVHAAIDNLLKGAAGQAVQNMNLLFGFAEDEGLKLKPIAF